jgi:hypothetical protein
VKIIMPTITLPFIRYPQGAGGSWLSALMKSLHHRDFAFDNKADYINWHDASGPNRGTDAKDSNDIVFGGAAGFNFFLNFWWKKRVFENYLNFNTLSDFKKLNVLADEARWIMYDSSYKQTYCDRIDIDWIWLWQDEAKFKTVLMHILKSPFTTDANDFVDTQIMLYKKSCVNAKYHLGNPFSLPWISWCYAIILENNIDIQVDAYNDRALPLISKFIVSDHDRFIDLSLPYILNIERHC